jgi:hypothetical protein
MRGSFYQCAKFRIEELVPPDVFQRFGQGAWMLLQPNALIMLDAIRHFYNVSVTVNDWLWGGRFSLRGFRPPTVTIGAAFSQHRFGGAFDLDVEGVPAGQVRQDILTHKDTHFHLINCLEADVNWVHFDVRNIPDRIRIVYP